MSLFLDVTPDLIVIADLGTSNFLANSLISSSLALPSIGGDFKCIVV